MNAKQVLVSTLMSTTVMAMTVVEEKSITAHRLAEDFEPTGNLSNTAWADATPVIISTDTVTGEPVEDLLTTTKAMYTENYLYMAWESKYTELTAFKWGTWPEVPGKRIGLWEKDVVEVFIILDPEQPNIYAELEFAPNAEWLDVGINLDADYKEWEYAAGTEFKVTIDEDKKVWTVESRIPLPLSTFGVTGAIPKSGDSWKINMFRFDYANDRYMAFNPTMKDPAAFHVPEAFIDLKFE